MPSSPAVLRDITDLKLDPKVPYKETSGKGRLTGKPLDSKHPAMWLSTALVHHVEPKAKTEEPKKVEPMPEPVKKVEAPAVVKAEPKVEPKVELKPEPKVEPKAEEPKTEPKPAAPAVAKKADKKDEPKKDDEKKPEEPSAS